MSAPDLLDPGLVGSTGLLHAPRPAPTYAAMTTGAEDRASRANPQPAADGLVMVGDGFDDLYRAHFGRIVALVHSLTGRRDIAEEIVQDAFVVTHDRWDRISQYDRPADFVRHVALNRARSSLRRRGAERRALDRVQGRAAVPHATNDAVPGDDHPLWQAVRKLPARQAQAIALTYVDDLPNARVAAILGCSENTLKTHLKRARATLAANLAEHDAEGSLR